jgi:hypothetical protein
MNIGPKESRKRLILGMALLAAGVSIAGGMALAGLNRWWRIGLFAPFWMGSLGIFQALEKT